LSPFGTADTERRSPNLWRIFVILVIVAGLAGVIFLQHSIDSSSASRASWREAAPLSAGQSVLDLLGGVRQALAAWIWTKTDTVFHAYGINLYENKSMYPYYKLVTSLDPRFTMAYYFASYMLFRLGKPEQGYALALEGLRNNPTSSLLQRNLAEIYLFFKKDPRKAKYHCERALAYASDEKDIVSTNSLLSLINQVLEGKKKIPDLISKEYMEKAGQHHHQEEGEYCPECEREKHGE